MSFYNLGVLPTTEPDRPIIPTEINTAGTEQDDDRAGFVAIGGSDGTGNAEGQPINYKLYGFKYTYNGREFLLLPIAKDADTGAAKMPLLDADNNLLTYDDNVKIAVDAVANLLSGTLNVHADNTEFDVTVINDSMNPVLTTIQGVAYGVELPVRVKNTITDPVIVSFGTPGDLPVSDSSTHTKLDNIYIALTGTVNVSDSATHTGINAIISSLQSGIDVYDATVKNSVDAVNTTLQNGININGGNIGVTSGNITAHQAVGDIWNVSDSATRSLLQAKIQSAADSIISSNSTLSQLERNILSATRTNTDHSTNFTPAFVKVTDGSKDAKVFETYSFYWMGNVQGIGTYIINPEGDPGQVYDKAADENATSAQTTLNVIKTATETIQSFLQNDVYNALQSSYTTLQNLNSAVKTATKYEAYYFQLSANATNINIKTLLTAFTTVSAARSIQIKPDQIINARLNSTGNTTIRIEQDEPFSMDITTTNIYITTTKITNIRVVILE